MCVPTISKGATLADYSMQIRNIQYTCDALTLAAQIHYKKFIMAGTIIFARYGTFCWRYAISSTLGWRLNLARFRTRL